MHKLLLITGDVVFLLLLISLITAVYHKTGMRAFWTSFFVAFLWSGLRITTTILFNEESPPGIGFLIQPPFYGTLGLVINKIVGLIKRRYIVKSNKIS